MHDRPALRIEQDGVTDGVSIEVKGVVKKKLHLARRASQITHHDLSHVDVGFIVDGVETVEPQASGFTLQHYLRDQGVPNVAERLAPFGGVDPSEGALLE